MGLGIGVVSWGYEVDFLSQLSQVDALTGQIDVLGVDGILGCI